MNIYVSNLPPSINEEQIRELFSRYGVVIDIHISMDKLSGVANGGAYVRMNNEEAQNAIDHLNGSDYKEYVLQVKKVDEADFPTDKYWG